MKKGNITERGERDFSMNQRTKKEQREHKQNNKKDNGNIKVGEVKQKTAAAARGIPSIAQG